MATKSSSSPKRNSQVSLFFESPFSSLPSDFLLDSNQKLFESLENRADDIDPNKFKKLVEIQFPKFDVELMHEEKIHKKLLDPKIRSTSGCTCTGVFLTPDHVVLFNVGDSRTILINENEDSPVIFASKVNRMS